MPRQRWVETAELTEMRQIRHGYRSGITINKALWRRGESRLTGDGTWRFGFTATLLLGVVALLSGCNRQVPAAAVPSQEPKVHKVEIFPHIRDYSPTTVPFSDNNAVVGTFHVSYEIEAPELVTKARLELRSNGYLVAWTDVPSVARGEADFKVEQAVEIGPTVKFQVQCPNGDSNWMAIGGMLPPPSSALPRIENITPDFVREEGELEGRPNGGGMDALVPFSIFGAGFQRDCTTHFTVNNGAPIEARGGYWPPHEMHVYITRRPLGRFDWSNQRYLVLSLMVERKISGPNPKAVDRKADVRAIPVVE